MPKPVKVKAGKEFSFKTSAGQPQKYDWDAWLNGDLLMLEQSLGEKNDKGDVTTVEKNGKRDFEVNVDAMVGKIRSAGRRKYKVVQISRYDADGHRLEAAVILRARDMTAEERVAEDKRRVAEEERREKRKGQGEDNGQPSE